MQTRYVFLILLAPMTGQAAEQTLAFPGAEGAGRFAVGGRGGDVYHVTNLADSGPGTLRQGIDSQRGPRTIVFDVGGTIDLKSGISIGKPFLTIAGQTAPGGGITLKGYHLQTHNTHDIIVRYLRVRPGDIHTTPKGYYPDSMTVAKCTEVIIDHLSASWSTDEVISVTSDANNITVQWSMITEALHNSNHRKGFHGYGALINGGDITYHHNLFAHNSSRNARPSKTAGAPNDTRLDFVNNVIYNPGGRYGYSGADEMYLNLVNNYGISGPNSTYGRLFHSGSKNTRIHHKGNFLDTNKNRILDGTGDRSATVGGAYTLTQARYDLPATTVETAPTALKSVLASVGASLYRDAVDARIVADVSSYGSRGKLLDSQKEVGGWPALPPGKRPKDTDQDGMPDGYENSIGHLDPLNPSDGRIDGNKNGYTDLEDYLHQRTLAHGPPTALSGQ